MNETRGLKLRIEDAEDLAAVSLHVQDAILRIGDMHRLPRLKRFALLLNRFRWESAGNRFSLKPQERVRAGLHFDFVTNVRIQGIAQDRRTEFLVLLAATFEPRDEPAGTIRLAFAGGGVLALDVECIDGALVDIGTPWRTANRPRHET
jgi:hypothetical protein